ncbi:hypothetical protein [Chryseobacterium aquaticum]|uniref:Phage tail protein n=1 Tax=Chryseobacterium aquaticum subsp. greenlandense TaxID=345663 RepID=A0A101CIB0_9FLAO|nr:hypothetical protein [Chryseobacterium aquaticum]KUJ56454.1 hypothetical protein AR686_07785 [Chryseobacterium aquaticum subsp. greenlandense]
MIEVKYFINYKNFRDYGVYVSDSIGIADELEKKPIQTYDWAEFHGISPDLRNIKFKERKIELKCFIDGENWEDMLINFKAFKEQLSRTGTQRIHIVPFEFKPLAYEVFMQDDIVLDKTFREGRMVGIFSINLIEPNPIKKILKTSLDKFQLSYDSATETEIFFGDGTKQTARGNVNFSKNYESPSYESSGINLVSISGVNGDFYEAYSIPTNEMTFRFSVDVILPSAKNIILFVIGRNLDNSYQAVSMSDVLNGKTGYNTIEAFTELNMSDYGKFIYKVLDSDGNEITGITYENARIETAEIIGEWQNMIGKEKIIIIAGNIEEIKNFETEAEVLWEKL